MPRVLNMRQKDGKLALSAGALYVGRPTIWGNPYNINNTQSRADVIDLFEQWMAMQPDLRARARWKLRGHDLVCWCAPLPCHAEALLRIANTTEEEYMAMLPDIFAKKAPRCTSI